MSQFQPRAACALVVLSSVCVHAQPALPPVVVTGNPLGASGIAAPAESLDGVNLLLRSQSSLGETLNALPGVSSTYFGPTASRPVIRGLDGDRVRILNNSGAMPDVSSLSYDHAVSVDPIAIERIEVLRGPAALLYGGSAIGGVVNVIDNRIPRLALEAVTGKIDASAATGHREAAGAMRVEAGSRNWAMHVDAFARRGEEVKAPTNLPCAQNGAISTGPRICNSSARAEGGAVGASWISEDAFIGASTTSFASRYGAVSEDEVSIAMRSDRHAFEAEWRKLAGWVEKLRVQASHGDYRHAEEEGGQVGTLFRQRSTDLRVEAHHRQRGSLRGVWGLQLDAGHFAAEGDEAFAPPSRTKQAALFAYEELSTVWGKLTAGARAERVSVEAFESPLVPRFLAAVRRFSPRSGAFGAVWNTAPAWQVTGHASHSERAPRDYELFANGPHIATGAYEIGNAALGLERARHFEVGVQWAQGASRLRLAAYSTRFTNYVSLSPTGNLQGGLPEFSYSATPARFRGFEASATARLLEGPHQVDLALRADSVRAQDDSNGEPLARIAPARIGGDITWRHGPWSAVAGGDVHARQARVPAGSAISPGYGLVRAALTYRIDAKDATLLFYAKLDNAADRLAYSATSILTQTAPGRVPLPGRSLRMGVQATF